MEDREELLLLLFMHMNLRLLLVKRMAKSIWEGILLHFANLMFGFRQMKVNLAGNVNPRKEGGNGGGRQGGGFGREQQQVGSSNTVFVANLSYDATQDSLNSLFSSCGEIADIRIGMRDGQPRGFAHVE